MKIKDIKQFGLPTGWFKEGKKGIDYLLPILKKFLTYLHIAHYDDCCPEGIEQLPTSYNADTQELRYWNPETKSLETIQLGEEPIPSNIEVLRNLGEFGERPYNPNTEIIIVNDPVLGGVFAKASIINSTPDDGVIFEEPNNGVFVNTYVWKRQNIDYVDIRWFGALADNSTDNTEIIRKAILSAVANLPSPKVYIPKSDPSEFYLLTDTLLITDRVEIFGDGRESKLRFPQDKAGLEFEYVTSRASVLKNFGITAYNDNAYFNGNAHGIIQHDVLYMDNVWIENFAGSGLYANTNTSPGNVNTSQYTNCHFLANKKHGFDITGADANACTIDGCEAVGNGGCGFYDQSFLGNEYYGLHSSSNGSPDLPYQRGLVKRGGVVYAAIRDNFSNIEPTVTSGWAEYWYADPNAQAWLGSAAVLTYNPATVYFTVGAWNLDGANKTPIGGGESQYGTMTGCYMELDQAAAYVGQRTSVFGGGKNYRGKFAGLFSEQASLYSPGPIYAGNPNVDPRYAVMDKDGVGVRIAAYQALLDLNTTYASADIKTTMFSQSVSHFFSPNTTAGMLGRTNFAANNGIFGTLLPMYMTIRQDRGKWYNFDLTQAKPTITGNEDKGDFLFAISPTVDKNLVPEVFMYKFTEPISGSPSEWETLYGYIEFEKTTTDASTVNVNRLYNINQVTAYEIDILAVIGNTGSVSSVDIWREKRLVTVGNSGSAATPTAYIADTQALGTPYKTAGITAATLAVVPNNSNRDLDIRINGIAATTIKWKIQVKRIII